MDRFTGKRFKSPSEPLPRVTGKRTAEMIRKDLAVARAMWLKEAKDEQTRRERGGVRLPELHRR